MAGGFIPSINPPVDEPRVFFSGWFLDEIQRGCWPFWSFDHSTQLVKLRAETKNRVWRLTGRLHDQDGLTGRDIGHEAIWPD